MPMVFEARRLPMEDMSAAELAAALEPYGGPSPDGIGLFLNSGGEGSDGESESCGASDAGSSSGGGGSGGEDIQGAGRLTERDLRMLSAVIPVVLASRGGGGGGGATLDAATRGVVLRVMKELNELESIYFGIKHALQNPQPDPWQMPDDLWGDDEEGRIEGEEEAEGDGGARAAGDMSHIDIAMCFTDDGDVIGVGSGEMFGGHGYHPNPKEEERGNEEGGGEP